MTMFASLAGPFYEGIYLNIYKSTSSEKSREDI